MECKKRKLSSNSVVCVCDNLSPDTLAVFVSVSPKLLMCVYRYIIVREFYTVSSGDVLFKYTFELIKFETSIYTFCNNI